MSAIIRSAYVLVAVGCTAGAVQAQQPERWVTETPVRIGSIDDPKQALTRIGQILIGEGGMLIVTQPRDQLLRFYDPAGRLLKIVGRRGRGPGEFETVGSAGFVGDTLYVVDPIIQRITQFDRAGQFIRTLDLPPSPMLGGPLPRVLLPTVPQVLLKDGSALVLPAIPIAWQELGDAKVPYLRMTPQNQNLDTLLWRGFPSGFYYLTHRGVRLGAPEPFPTAPLYEFMADGSGIVVVERPIPGGKQQGKFFVAHVGPLGDTTFAVAIPYTPRPVPTELVHRAARDGQAFMARRVEPPDEREIERFLRRDGLLPSSLPAVTELATGQDGTIWLRREEQVGEDVVWNVMDRTGQVIASIGLPAGQSVMAAAPGLLIVVEHDSLDVPYVVRYRIGRR